MYYLLLTIVVVFNVFAIVGKCDLLAQLVRAPPLQGGSPEFDSQRGYIILYDILRVAFSGLFLSLLRFIRT